jgi:transposase-like protein
MKCTNCQDEWTPLDNQSLGKCPFCQADILQMLNTQAEVLSTEVILGNMLQAYGGVQTTVNGGERERVEVKG